GGRQRRGPNRLRKEAAGRGQVAELHGRKQSQDRPVPSQGAPGGFMPSRRRRSLRLRVRAFECYSRVRIAREAAFLASPARTGGQYGDQGGPDEICLPAVRV